MDTLLPERTINKAQCIVTIPKVFEKLENKMAFVGSIAATEQYLVHTEKPIKN